MLLHQASRPQWHCELPHFGDLKTNGEIEGQRGDVIGTKANNCTYLVWSTKLIRLAC
jgi:hypothetical protein